MTGKRDLGEALSSERVRSFDADRGDHQQRLDRVLVRHLADVPGVSRSQIQGWISAGQVTVNGRPAVRVAQRLSRGETVQLLLPDRPPVRRRPQAEAIPLRVLFEDEHLLAVDKPAGMLVHPTPGRHRGTLLNALLAHAQGWNGDRQPRLVQRLDRDTSGVLLVAKHRQVHAALQRSLAGAEAVKEYRALVYGAPAQAKGRIDLRLRQDPDDPRRRIASRREGLSASTRYEVLAVSRGPGPGPGPGPDPGASGLAWLACRLETGRTHQIRAHLAASGWPLVGDPLYGQPRWKGLPDPALARACRDLGRQALHARRLTFVHPVERGPVTVSAPVPKDLAQLLVSAGLRRGEAKPSES